MFFAGAELILESALSFQGPIIKVLHFMLLKDRFYFAVINEI